LRDANSHADSYSDRDSDINTNSYAYSASYGNSDLHTG
jgi:hypothetical protein